MALHLPPKLNAHLRDPLLGARTAGGSPVVGFMSNQVPVELIHAAGCLPIQVPTAPVPTPHTDALLDAHAEPSVRSVLERLLDGTFACLDLLVLPASIAPLQRLYHTARDARGRVSKPMPELFLYDVLPASRTASTEHNRACMRALKRRLEALAGKPTDDAALAASIAVYNALRAKLDALVARRRQLPCLLEGALAMDVFVVSQTMRPSVLGEVLDRLLGLPATPAEGTRTLLLGSAHDSSALHRLIARAGGQVVGDHHWRGELLFGPAVDTRLPPLRALGSHYHGDHVSSHTFPSNNEALVTFAKRARCEAAVFFYFAHDDALSWDYAAQSEALSASGIPALPLELQPYPPGPGLEDTLRGFYESVRRF